MKKCTSCEIEKDLDDYYMRDSNGNKRIKMSQCKRCIKERVAAQRLRYRAKDPLWQRKLDLKHHYGMTIEDYNELFAEQKGCCAICEMHQSNFNTPLTVDHSHVTGEIRGLLCTRCNIGIGNLQADKTVRNLENAIIYLNQFNSELAGTKNTNVVEFSTKKEG